jgi:hypothetical protein
VPASSGGYTAEQLLAKINAQKAKGGGSFLDDIEGGIKFGISHALSDTLNFLSRPGWMISGAVRAGLEHPVGTALNVTDWSKFESDWHHIIGQGLEGAAGRTHHNFGEILKEQGWVHHTVWRAIAGVTLDIATDPSNLLLIAATPETGGASAAAFLFKEGLLKGLGEAGGRATIRDLMVKAGEESAKWDKALQETKFGEKPLGDITAADLHAMTPEEIATGVHHMQQAEIFKQIKLEAEKWLPRKITAGLWLPTLWGGKSILIHEGVPILGKALRFMPYAPNTLRIAEGLTKFSHVPLGIGEHVIQPTARKLADLFKPGWRDPITHARPWAVPGTPGSRCST